MHKISSDSYKLSYELTKTILYTFVIITAYAQADYYYYYYCYFYWGPIMTILLCYLLLFHRSFFLFLFFVCRKWRSKFRLGHFHYLNYYHLKQSIDFSYRMCVGVSANMIGILEWYWWPIPCIQTNMYKTEIESLFFTNFYWSDSLMNPHVDHRILNISAEWI